MKKYGLPAGTRRHRKRQQMRQQVHKYKNLLNREFYANSPNSKWVTDISCIHTKQGILYLSMIQGPYDNAMAENLFKTECIYAISLPLSARPMR